MEGLAGQLTLRGLNIQRPFSQLLITCRKTADLRSSALRHSNIAQHDEELWVIETPGSSASADANAVVAGVSIADRPSKAQIIGTATFDRSEPPYEDVAAFRADEERHCIREGGAKDWSGEGERHAWHVSMARPLAKPIPTSSNKTLTGIGRPAAFKITFARSRVSAERHAKN